MNRFANYTVILLFLALASSRQVAAQSYIHKKYSYAVGQCSHAVLATAKDAAVVVAYNRSAGADSYLDLLRVDTSGTTVWANSFKPAGNGLIPVNMVATADSGSMVILADTLQMKQIQLVKIGKAGNLHWTKVVSAEYYTLYRFPAVALDDGGVFFCYPSNDTVFIQRLDAAGNIVSGTGYSLNGTSVISPSSMVLNGDAIYVGGYDNSSYLSFLFKADTLGNIQWQATGIAGLSLSLNLQPVMNGGVLVTTQSRSPFEGGLDSTRIASISADGNLNWALKVPRFNNARLVRVDDSTYAVCSHKNAIISLALIDSSGQLRNMVSYTDSLATILFGAAAIYNNGIWIGSAADNYLWLMRASSSGNTSCFERTDTLGFQPFSFAPAGYNLQAHPFTAILSNATFTTSNNPFTGSDLCSTATVTEPKIDETRVFPNPASGELYISHGNAITGITVTDMMGKLHYKGIVPQNGIVDISSLIPGIYILSICDKAGHVSVRKFVKQ